MEFKEDPNIFMTSLIYMFSHNTCITFIHIHASTFYPTGSVILTENAYFFLPLYFPYGRPGFTLSQCQCIQVFQKSSMYHCNNDEAGFFLNNVVVICLKFLIIYLSNSHFKLRVKHLPK